MLWREKKIMFVHVCVGVCVTVYARAGLRERKRKSHGYKTDANFKIDGYFFIFF